MSVRSFSLVLSSALFLILSLPSDVEAASGYVYLGDSSLSDTSPGDSTISRIGLEGIVVSNGVAVTRTSASGYYILEDSHTKDVGEFIFVTRQAGYNADQWFKPVSTDSVDFVLRRSDPNSVSKDQIFFVQLSDSHVYDQAEDFLAYSSPQVPWFVPEFVYNLIAVGLLQKQYGDEVIDKLRRELKSVGWVSESEAYLDSTVYDAYSRYLRQEGLNNLDATIRTAFSEINGLSPDFVINSGDLILESNRGTAQAIQRWFDYYRDIEKNIEAPVYNTIGNNELAGTERLDFLPSQPGYGKRLYKKNLGPTHFSFDYGQFHFVALDTHSKVIQKDRLPDKDLDLNDDVRNDESWSYGKMTPDISQWLDQDLLAHQDQTLVVVNHEPFHFDPDWPFEEDQSADDDGLFAKHSVDYVLSGHTHYRSHQRIDGTEHLTTGALSGMRWVLPATIHERGYRMFYGLGQKLVSVWKPLGTATIEFVEPPLDAKDRLIFAAIDSRQAFDSVTVEMPVGGKPETVVVKKLNNYFYEINKASLAQSQTQTMITVVTTSRSGTVTKRNLTLPQ
jgi:hypothetical protein